MILVEFDLNGNVCNVSTDDPDNPLVDVVVVKHSGSTDRNTTGYDPKTEAIVEALEKGCPICGERLRPRGLICLRCDYRVIV